MDKIQGNIVNISFMAKEIIDKGEIQVGEFSNLARVVVEIAEKFEQEYTEELQALEDYYGIIDDFARKELLERANRFVDL